MLRKYATAVLVFALCLPLLCGCVGTPELKAMSERQMSANAQAEQIIELLKQRDQQLIEIANAGLEQYPQADKNQIELLHAQTQIAMLNDRDLALAQIQQVGTQFIEKCKTAVNDANIKLANLVKEAEQTALAMHRESQAFPDDKTLALQAAKAAADYFGRRTTQLETTSTGLTRCNDSISQLIQNRQTEITRLFDGQKGALSALEKSYVGKALGTTLPAQTTQDTVFNELSALAQANYKAAEDTLTYVNTNTPFSSDGASAHLFKGFRKGVIGSFFSGIPHVPNSEDVKQTGRALFDGITAEAKQEFAKIPEQANSLYSATVADFKASAAQKITDILIGLAPAQPEE